MTLSKNVIKQGETTTPTFQYHGATVSSGITYTTDASTANFSINGTSGVFTYTSGNTADFAGGAFTITATYTTGGNTYTAKQIVFAQSNIQVGILNIPNINIKTGATSSGAATMTVNGSAVSSNVSYECYYNSTKITTQTTEGLTFSGSTLT
jgi:hypothetical protein